MLRITKVKKNGLFNAKRQIEKQDLLKKNNYAIYHLSIKKIKYEKKVKMNFQVLLYFSFILDVLILVIKLFISQTICHI